VRNQVSHIYRTEGNYIPELMNLWPVGWMQPTTPLHVVPLTHQ